MQSPVQHGMLCENIRNCALLIEARVKSGSCQATIQMISSDKRVQLEWHVDSSNMMKFTTSMNSYQSKHSYNHGYPAMDLKADHILTDGPCAVKITQTLEKSQSTSLHQTIVKSDISSSCLTKQAYFDDSALRWKTHCFK